MYKKPLTFLEIAAQKQNKNQRISTGRKHARRINTVVATHDTGSLATNSRR